MSNVKFIRCIVLLILVGIIGQLSLVKVHGSEEVKENRSVFERLGEFVLEPDPITNIGDIIFSYDKDSNRIEKTQNRIITRYVYQLNRLVAENGKHNISYDYDSNGICKAIVVDGELYYLVYDETGNVNVILDKERNIVSKYRYDGSKALVYNPDVNNGYVENTDPDFVGNINPIRYLGWYYDVETGCYYLGKGIYYDTETQKFIQNDYRLSLERLRNEPQEINTIVTAYTMYMSDPSFGATAYSNVTENQWTNLHQRWYDGIGQVELITRCIYAEDTASGTVGDDNRTAEAVVILNRISTGMDSTPYNAVKRQSQFSSINPGTYALSNSETQIARAAMSKTDARIQNALLIACSIYYYQSKTILGYMSTIPNYINDQLFFLGFRYVHDNNLFTASGGNVCYGGNAIYSVALPGVTQITSSNLASVLATYYNQGHNVYFKY